MKKISRKLLLGIFTFCAAAFLVWMNPEDTNAAGNEQYFSYTVKSDGTAEITGCTAFYYDTDVEIPEKIDGYTVTSLKPKLFYSNYYITSVKIPKTVTYLGIWDYVFSYCDNLKAIYVDSKNPALCSVDGVLFSKDKTTLYNFPCGKNTESYHIPSTVDEICCTSFARAKYLKNIYIDNPNAIWYTYAFWGDGDARVYYKEGGLSETRANSFISMGYSADSSSEWPHYAKMPNLSGISGLAIGGRAADALRLNWNRSDGASGYIVEQYKNGAWTRIARIGSGNTLTWRVAGLSSSTVYKFRVQSFAFNGNTPIYSDYSYIDGKTNPSAVAGLKIGGTAKDALRLNWTKNSGASGYIIEQYKNGAWTRIARIASNSTVTYRVEKLSAGTTYKFRVQAFAFDGSTPLYSTYQTISGKTNAAATAPNAVTGLCIGGTAKDALRLNWNKNSSASGYIIEQYKNGAWTRIARIASNSTVTYRVEKLSSGTTYKFRVQAFAFDGSTPLYSSYQYVNGTTNK